MFYMEKKRTSATCLLVVFTPPISALRVEVMGNTYTCGSKNSCSRRLRLIGFDFWVAHKFLGVMRFFFGVG